ncbi:MAG: hypothetical protein H7240_04485 [Glaciimonas sp.]|nr:hypothetical protein [Glaciimonas sp.]
MYAADGVFDIQSHHMKLVKHPANIGVIVDTEHHLVFAGTHDLGHLFVLLEAENNAIFFGFLIRWIEVGSDFSAEGMLL